MNVGLLFAAEKRYTVEKFRVCHWTWASLVRTTFCNMTEAAANKYTKFVVAFRLLPKIIQKYTDNGEKSDFFFFTSLKVKISQPMEHYI